MALGADIATRRRRLRAGLVAISVVGATFWAQTSATAARLLGIQGAQIERYGRIILRFDGPVSVKARVSGSVLGTSITDEASPMVSSRSSRRDSASASP